MEAINHSLFNNNNLANLLSQTTQEGLNSQYGVYTRTKAKAQLEITTAEGDRVTLFSQSKAETAYASYDSRGKLTGTESAGTTSMYQVVSTNKVSIAVDGNLNEEELADIQRLLQSVEDLFMSSISDDGTINENIALSLSWDSMKTLSHFDAQLKYSQKIEGFGVVTDSTGQNPDTTTSHESEDSGNGLISETNEDAISDLTTFAAFKSRTKASLHLSGTRLTMEEPAQSPSTEIVPDAGTSVTDSGTGSTGGGTTLPSTVETKEPGSVTNSASMLNFEAKIKTSIYFKVAQSYLNNTPAVSGTPQEPTIPGQPPADRTSTPVSKDGANGSAVPNQATDTNSANPGRLSSLSTSRKKLVQEFAALIQQYPLDMKSMSSVFSQFIPSLIEQLKKDYPMDETQKGAVTQMGEDILNTFQSTSPELIQ